MDRETSPFQLTERVEVTKKAPPEFRGKMGQVTTIEHDENFFQEKAAHYLLFDTEKVPCQRPFFSDELHSLNEH